MADVEERYTMTCKHNPEKAAELVMRCFNARTQGHILHLAARASGSFALHTALGSFYSGIGELADAFAEAFQGATQSLLKVPALPIKAQAPMAMLSALEKWILDNRAGICSLSNIQNEIDSIVTLIHSTMYKVKFLE